VRFEQRPLNRRSSQITTSTWICWTGPWRRGGDMGGGAQLDAELWMWLRQLLVCRGAARHFFPTAALGVGWRSKDTGCFAWPQPAFDYATALPWRPMPRANSMVGYYAGRLRRGHDPQSPRGFLLTPPPRIWAWRLPLSLFWPPRGPVRGGSPVISRGWGVVGMVHHGS